MKGAEMCVYWASAFLTNKNGIQLEIGDLLREDKNRFAKVNNYKVVPKGKGGKGTRKTGPNSTTTAAKAS